MPNFYHKRFGYKSAEIVVYCFAFLASVSAQTPANLTDLFGIEISRPETVNIRCYHELKELSSHFITKAA